MIEDEPLSQAQACRINSIQITLTLFKCQDLKMNHLGEVNPYVYIEVGDYKTAKSDTYYNMSDISFDGKRFEFALKITMNQLKTLKIQLSVWHKTSWYSLKDILIGAYSIDAYRIYSNENQFINNEWATLENRNEVILPSPGSILFSLMVKGDKDKMIALQHDLNANVISQVDDCLGKEKPSLNTLIQGQPVIDITKKYAVIINVLRGEFIRDMTILGINTLSSFFKVKYSLNDNMTSTIIANSISPEYEEQISFPISFPINVDYIVIEVYHCTSLFSSNVLIGKTVLNFTQLVRDWQLENKWYNIYGPERENTLTNQLTTLLPTFLSFATYDESYFYFGRMLMSAKLLKDDNPLCGIQSNKGLRLPQPEEKEYKLWVDIFKLLQDGYGNIPENDNVNVEIQIGRIIIEPNTMGKWNSEARQYEWPSEKESRIKEHFVIFPKDELQIPDIFIRIYTKTFIGNKTYIGYERLKVGPFLKKKMIVKPQTIKFRKCQTALKEDNEQNYLGTLLFSLNFFQRKDNQQQQRPIPLDMTNQRKFKLMSVIYMAKNLPMIKGKLPSCYVSVDFNACKTRSTHIEEESDCPIWEETLKITTLLNTCLELSQNAIVTINTKSTLSDIQLGTFEVHIGDLKEFIGKYSIPNEIFPLAKWYKLTNGLQVVRGELLAGFFIVKLTEKGKEEIDLKNHTMLPPLINYKLSLFMLGIRNTTKDIQGYYTEVRYDNKQLNTSFKKGNERRFMRKMYNTNNLNNFEFIREGDKGYVTIQVYNHPLFIKPLSVVITNGISILYTGMIDLGNIIKLKENDKEKEKECNGVIPSVSKCEVTEDDKVVERNQLRVARLKEELFPHNEDCVPLYRPVAIEQSDLWKYEDMYYHTMLSFPLDQSLVNHSSGREFSICVNRNPNDIHSYNNDLIADNDDDTEAIRPEIKEDYEDLLKESHSLDFMTSHLYNEFNSPKETGIIRYIIRVIKDTGNEESTNSIIKQVEQIAYEKYMIYYSSNILQRKSPEFICRIYIFNASNLILTNKNISNCYVWIKRFNGDTEYKKKVELFNIAAGSINFYDQINIVWPETFLLTISLYGHDDTTLIHPEDEYIGETTIDLEKRYFHQDYQNKLTIRTLNQIPIENRTLYNKGLSTGAIRLLVEIFPKEKESEFRKTSIERKEKNKYQLRIVIWSIDDVPMIDKSIDLFVKATFQESDLAETTDVHRQSTDGHGEFNYRLIYDFEYPHESHYLHFSICKENMLGSEVLGSNSFNMEPYLRRVHKTKTGLEIDKETIYLNANDAIVGKGVKEGGSITLQMKILTLSEVEINPVGKGRSQPNNDPELFEPKTGRESSDSTLLLTPNIKGLHNTTSDIAIKYIKFALVLISVGVLSYIIYLIVSAFNKD